MSFCCCFFPGVICSTYWRCCDSLPCLDLFETLADCDVFTFPLVNHCSTCWLALTFSHFVGLPFRQLPSTLPWWQVNLHDQEIMVFSFWWAPFLYGTDSGLPFSWSRRVGGILKYWKRFAWWRQTLGVALFCMSVTQVPTPNPTTISTYLHFPQLQVCHAGFARRVSLASC